MKLLLALILNRLSLLAARDGRYDGTFLLIVNKTLMKEIEAMS